jgi:hypothetical protein
VGLQGRKQGCIVEESVVLDGFLEALVFLSRIIDAAWWSVLSMQVSSVSLMLPLNERRLSSRSVITPTFS